MLQLSGKARRRVLSGLIVILFFLVLYIFRDLIPLIFFPAEKVLSTIIDFPRKVAFYFKDRESLQRDLNDKEFQLQKLKIEISKLEVLKRENEILRKYLQFKISYGINNITIAKVIDYSSDNWIKGFKIDVGEKDNIKRGDLVVYNGFVVGMVDRVFPSFSVVLAINDKNFKITARTQKTGEICLYQGFDERTGHLKYVRPDQDIRIGDVVITETVSKNIPSGIPIGVIKGISQKEGEFFRSVEVSLMYRYTVLDYVMVVSR